MKKYFPGVVIAAMLLAVTLWWLKGGYFNNTETGEAPLTSQIQTESNGDAENAPNLAAVEADDVTTGKGHAKRIVHVPDNNSDKPQSEREIDIEFQQSTETVLQSALDGKSEDAVGIGQLVRICSAETSEDRVLAMLSSYSDVQFTSGRNFSFGNGQRVSIDSFEELESFLWTQFDHCRSVQSLFDDDLHDRIHRMAENGNVVARYLYAMWPPKVTGIETEDILKRLDYQSRALEYTWKNIDAREPLGVLAFGQSFGAAQPGLFTPVDFTQNRIFLLAAKKCVQDDSSLVAEIDKINADGFQVGTGRINDRVEVVSDEISNLFCQ
jgi:hypothetical protein